MKIPLTANQQQLVVRLQNAVELTNVRRQALVEALSAAINCIAQDAGSTQLAEGADMKLIAEDGKHYLELLDVQTPTPVSPKAG